MKEFNLNNKTIIVTGCNGIIGKSISKALSSYGADLILIDIVDQSKINKQTRDLQKKFKNKILPIKLDINNEIETKKIFKNINKIDVLINLAAIDAKVNEGKEYVFDKKLLKNSLNTNLIGTSIFTDFILKKMIKRKKGNIINVASTYSIVSPNINLYKGTNTFKLNKPLEYILSKSFIPNYSRYIATTYARKGIRCNTIVPHAVITNNKNNKFKKNFLKLSPIGRFCKPSELNGVFIFLSSDSSSYMNGALITLDGGWTAW